MTTIFRLRLLQIATVFLAVFLTNPVHAEDAANQGNVSISGHRSVYRKVLAVRGKSSDENRIIVLATGQTPVKRVTVCKGMMIEI